MRERVRAWVGGWVGECACHEICTSNFTNCCAYREICFPTRQMKVVRFCVSCIPPRPPPPPPRLNREGHVAAVCPVGPQLQRPRGSELAVFSAGPQPPAPERTGRCRTTNTTKTTTTNTHNHKHIHKHTTTTTKTTTTNTHNHKHIHKHNHNHNSTITNATTNTKSQHTPTNMVTRLFATVHS